MRADGIRELLRQAQAGDLQAMDKLLESIRQHLDAFARRTDDPNGSESASDIVQEAELRVWRSLPTFRGAADDEGTRAALLAWVQKIVRNLELNARRDRNAKIRMPPEGILPLDAVDCGDSSSERGRMEPAASELTPRASAEAEEEAQLVRQAIERIPDAAGREIIWLRYFEGLSLAQIAERLGLSFDKVRELHRYCLSRLENDLSGSRR